MAMSETEPDPAAVFAALGSACLRRFLAQNEKPALPEAELARLAARVWRVMAREAALLPAAGPEWREIPAALVESMAREILDEVLPAGKNADLAVPVRQLLKACLQAEPVRCRESYREVVGGSCRRQDLARARGRISGAHCIDCPHWVALEADRNAALLERSWVVGPVTRFQAHRDVFLPEDFRALRRWVRQAIRPV
jgi:hypothetical protein